MKIVSNRYNVALIALLLSVNNVNSHVIRDINPTLKKAGECTEENHCGADIKCIAKCYNVLNNDEESMKRTYECQHICNVKYPDPYIDTEDLTQCYEKCIYQEFYRGNNNIIDENKVVDNIHSQSNQSNQSEDSFIKNDDNNNNTDTTSSGERNKDKNNQGINNANESKVNSSANTVVNDTDDTDDNNNSNNSNNNNNNKNLKKRNYIAENGLENQAFYSILVTELVLVLTLFYYVS